MTDNYMNKYIIVKDNIDGSIICKGKCVSQKLNFLQLVSIDNKYFFHVDNSQRYQIILSEDQEEVKFDVQRYKKDMKFIPFTKAMGMINNGKMQLHDTYFFDVFIENNENELDEEVVEIVRALNRIKGLRTTGSCSGHYIRKPWVIIEFNNLEGVSRLNMIINNKMFCDYFTLSNDKKINLIEGCLPSMTLFCNKRLPFANKYLKKLVEYIDSIT